MSAATSKAVLQVGPSFAALGLYDGPQLKAHKQIYLPQEPLGNALKKFWAEHGTPSQVFVNSQFLEKILDSKLGGTVAQIVTHGFETWPVLRQPVWPDYFDLKSQRQAPLASQSLIFGLSERISAEGKVLQELKMEELEFINEKLKLMTVKRVCVNLLFSNLYPQHQESVAKYFREQGFEVFAYQRPSDSQDEMPAWRKNIINACLSGVFSEHVEDIKNSLPDENIEIAFLDSNSGKFLLEKDNIASSLFAWANSLAHKFSAQADQVLYLGLENWSLVSTLDQSNYWVSPWGRIEIKSPTFHRLRTQPTQELVPGFWGGVDFSNPELGYEPGPMSFGRALKPMAYDLMQVMFSLELAQNNAQGDKKLRNHLGAMIKNIPHLQENSIEKLAKTFVSQIAYQVATEAAFKGSGYSKTKNKTILTGYFAKALYPLIQENWALGDLVLDENFSQCEVGATFSLSQELL